MASRTHFLHFAVFNIALPYILLCLLPGCRTLQTQSSFGVGEIYRVASQEKVSLEAIRSELMAADVIFIGEEHYTPSHLEAAKSILDILLAHERRPALAMEMFSWDGQAGLDRYIAHPETPRAEFLTESHWEQNWGGDYPNYEPLVNYAREHHLQLLALNPPLSLVRLVATKGLTEAMKSSALSSWDMNETVVNDAEYEKLIYEQITACHPQLPGNAYRRIFEASIVRDEGMARVIRNYLDHQKDSHSPLVSYTGGGHIQYGIPVPKRVKRTHPGVKTLIIYLVAWDPSKKEEVMADLTGGIADYLWLTTLGPKGIQPKCG